MKQNAMSQSVSVVITNRKNPENIGEVASAWRNQAGQRAHLILVNARGGSVIPFSVEYLFDAYVEMPDSGTLTRYLAAPLIYSDYTIFADDDFLPGPNAIEHLLESAKALNNRFACLGEVGYHLPKDKPARAVYRSGLIKRVDGVRRCYFYNSAHLPLIDAQRRALWPEGYCTFADLLAQAIIQMQTGFSSYITPAPYPLEVNAGKTCFQFELTENDDVPLWNGPGMSSVAQRLFERGWIPQSRSKECQSCGKSK